MLPRTNAKRLEGAWMTLERFLGAGGMAVVGVVVGAFLTHLFGALTRRRHEKREDRTRWYERRLQAYIEFYQTVYEVFFSLGATALRTKRPLTENEAESLLQRLLNDLGTIHFVGSPEVIDAAEKVMMEVLPQLDTPQNPSSEFIDELEGRFQAAARKDLGHPVKGKF
jgi:hypothetical protein